MTTETTLKDLESELAGLLGEAPPIELREFSSHEEFRKYAQSELIQAAGETDPEERTARLKHLLENVRMTPMLKFEDKNARSLPVFSGKLSVQAQTAWKERSEKTISLQQAANSQAPGPKGFAQKGHAGDLLASLTSLLDGDGEGEGTPAGATKDGEGTPAGATKDGGGTPAGVTKDGEGTPAGVTKDGGGDGATPPAAKEGDGTGGGGPTPTEKAMKDPWGSGMDMNITDVEVDKDEFGGDQRVF